ncbi:MAG: hypothetical protein FWH48_09075, partial [Oscillospiraceae bacterium]|nr:hypothetical protein [Oscillospiraceae bacterium]
MKKIIFLLLLCLALGSCEDKPAPKADGESTTMTEAEKGEEFEKTEEAEEAEEVEEVEEVVWEARTIVFDNCDTAKGWQGGPKTDTAEYVEGEGSVAFTVKKNGDQFVVSKAFSDPIDVSDMTAVEFDLYLSNPELMEKHRYLSLEISSSGVCDV